MKLPYLCCWSLFLTLVSCKPAAEQSGPRLIQTADHLTLSVSGQPVITYHLTPELPEGQPEIYRRSGFIHPVHAPNGYVVTDGFPLGHTHQHGIFTAWTKTRFRGDTIDFWNQQKGTGTVEHVSVLETNENAETAGFRVKLRHLSTVYGPVLEEEWHVRVHADADPFRWELRSVQTNVTADTLFLLQHVYGGLGIRGSRNWNAVDTTHFVAAARFLTSAGLDRLPANNTRPEWTMIYGDSASLKVIPSPENFRSPQFVRVHPEMPYLSVTPVVEEGFFIAPGAKYETSFAFEVSGKER